jgi:hypothetical protein
MSIFFFLFFRSCVPMCIFISRTMTQLEFDNHNNNEGCCLRLKKNSPVERWLDEEKNVPCSSSSSFLLLGAFFCSTLHLTHTHIYKENFDFLCRLRWCCYCEFFHHFFTAIEKNRNERERDRQRQTAKKILPYVSLSLSLFLLCCCLCDPDGGCNDSGNARGSNNVDGSTPPHR